MPDGPALLLLRLVERNPALVLSSWTLVKRGRGLREAAGGCRADGSSAQAFSASDSHKRLGAESRRGVVFAVPELIENRSASSITLLTSCPESRAELSTSILQAFLRTRADPFARPTGRRCSSGRHLRTRCLPKLPSGRRSGSGESWFEPRRGNQSRSEVLRLFDCPICGGS